MPQLVKGQRVRLATNGRVGTVAKPPKYAMKDKHNRVNSASYDPMARIEFGDGTRRLVDCSKLEVV